MWHERTSLLDPSSPNRIGWEKGEGKLEREKEGDKKEGNFREKCSNFSLNFPTIKLSVSGEARSKVAPHDESYAWVPVLWSFHNSER